MTKPNISPSNVRNKEIKPNKDWREVLRKKAQTLADTLQDYNGISECKICGADPVKQAEWVINLVDEKVSEAVQEFAKKIVENIEDYGIMPNGGIDIHGVAWTELKKKILKKEL